MRVFEDYIQIRQAFPSSEGKSFHVSMSEFANILYCSPRNAKIILMKMEELKWISFTPGKGRGHTSEITFLLSKEVIMRQEAEKLVMEGNITGALTFIKTYGDETAVTEQFLQWLSHYFGAYIQENEEEYIEILKLPIFRTINTLDPADAFYALDSHLVMQVFNTLVNYNADSQEIEPSLSYFWEGNEDSTIWTFHLRKKVFFHHGKELTAADVEFSFNRLIREKKHWITAHIGRIEVVSRYSLNIYLDKPNHLFLQYVSYTPCAIIPNDSTFFGTGPYQVLSYNSENCILAANDHYFLERPLIDRIDILRVPKIDGFEPKFHLLMVNTGESETSIISDWTKDEQISGTSVLTININKKEPLQNLSFRKSLYHLIDREKLANELGSTRHHPAHRFRIENNGIKKDEEFRLEKAIRELKESTYNGEKLHLYTYERHAADAFWLKEQYSGQGIYIEVHIMEWKDMLKQEVVQNADLILFEAVMSEGIIRFIEYFQSPVSFIRSHMEPELISKIDLWIEKALSYSDPDIIEEKLFEIEDYMKEHYRFIFLNYKSVSTLSHASLEGVKVNSKGWVDFSSIWFKK